MRAIFGMVLAAGVATAVGLSMLMHRGEPAPDEPRSQGGSDAPGPLRNDDTPAAGHDAIGYSPPAPTSALAVRLEEMLRRNDVAGAKQALASADPGELGSAAVRDRAFDTADALVAAADAATDASAVAFRLDARHIFATLYARDEATASEAQRAFDSCAKLHQSLLFGNGAPDALVLRHKVQPGESVWALAKGTWRQKGVTVPAGLVLHMNGVADARRLRAGQTLRVPLEPLGLLIRKSRFELTVLLGEAPLERFSVAIGADATTPAGVFRVRDRIKNPDWYFHGKRIPYGDPQNIIGTRWIGLTGSASIEGIGIHGTTDDASIGKAASMGCIRMHNADVEKLFEWLDAGVRVEIRD